MKKNKKFIKYKCKSVYSDIVSSKFITASIILFTIIHRLYILITTMECKTILSWKGLHPINFIWPSYIQQVEKLIAYFFQERRINFNDVLTERKHFQYPAIHTKIIICDINIVRCEKRFIHNVPRIIMATVSMK